jgi:hypothetical protein
VPRCVLHEPERAKKQLKCAKNRNFKIYNVFFLKKSSFFPVKTAPGLVAEPVVAVLPHAVKMSLMFPVVAVRKLTVLIKPATQ